MKLKLLNWYDVNFPCVEESSHELYILSQRIRLWWVLAGIFGCRVIYLIR
jgi:hypothetical protein